MMDYKEIELRKIINNTTKKVNKCGSEFNTKLCSDKCDCYNNCKKLDKVNRSM